MTALGLHDMTVMLVGNARATVVAWGLLAGLALLWIWWAGLWFVLSNAVGTDTTADRVVTAGTFLVDPSAIVVLAVSLIRRRIHLLVLALLSLGVVLTVGPIVVPTRYWGMFA